MFSIDGKLYEFCNRMVMLFILNLLIVLTSLPIITIGASLLAAFECLNKQLDYKNLIVYYIHAFKSNIVRSLPFLTFNIFSFLFYQSTIHSEFTTNGIKFISFLFNLFLVTYNINLYIMASEIKNGSAYRIFTDTFPFTIVTAVRTGVLLLLVTVVIKLNFQLLYILISLFGLSGFLMLYRKVINRKIKLSNKIES